MKKSKTEENKKTATKDNAECTGFRELITKNEKSPKKNKIA